MSKKEAKDPNAVVVIRRLLEIIDLGMIENIQEAEESIYVAKNLEITESFCSKKSKTFFSRSSDKINKILHKSGSSPIFNHSLNDASVDRISVLIDYLSKHVQCDGIFRRSGYKSRQEDLKHLLDKDEVVDFEKLDTFTIHDVASVLKKFLYELPEPIIISAHIEVHMQILDLDDEEKQIKALQLLFLLLPPANRRLLQLLLELCHEITSNKDNNRMTAYNLAVVFAPTIMQNRNKLSCLSTVSEDITTSIAAVLFMIQHGKKIFTIPVDLLQELEEQKRLRNAQVITRQRSQSVKDGGNSLVKTRPLCAQVDARLYHTTGNKTTSDALVDLYAQMAEMEDTPMKREFLKKFSDFYPGTPPFKPAKTRKPVPNTAEPRAQMAQPTTKFTAPKIRSPRFHRLSRLPLQTANQCNDTNTLCDSPTGKFRMVQTPVIIDCLRKSVPKPGVSCEDMQVPATPSGHFGGKFTPTRTGSFRNPFKRRRRTQSIGSPGETTRNAGNKVNSSSSSNLFSRPFTPRRTSSSSELEKLPCVQLCGASGKLPIKTTTPCIRKSLIGRDIRNLYSTPMNSRKHKIACSSAAK